MSRPVIYEPKGKAAEYAPLALNLYRGCSHGCLYCYGPQVTHIPRGQFFNPAFIRVRRRILEDLAFQAQAMAGDPRPILLSFTSDPYQELERVAKATRRALEILMSNALTVTILTKGGGWGLERDRDLLTMNPQNTWAVTLTLDDSVKSLLWEPMAAIPKSRISALKAAKHLGLKTWVSFEPVICPEAVYRLLEVTHEFVDLYKVGKLNYHPRAKEINWPRFREEIKSRLEKLGKPYLIKKDLQEAT
jgi:DNA repair photolyase